MKMLLFQVKTENICVTEEKTSLATALVLNKT